MLYLGVSKGRVCYEFASHEIETARPIAARITNSKTLSDRAQALSGRKRYDIDLWGLLAEMLVHHHYGLPYTIEVNPHGGDYGWDMILDGARFQIKATPYTDNPRLCVKLTETSVAHIYMLCRIDVQRGAGQILGYATRGMLFCSENIGRLRDDLPLNYMLREDQLKRCQPVYERRWDATRGTQG